MKKVGIVGGLGPESTVEYYKSIITTFQEKRRNKKEQPELLINSIDMYKMFDYLDRGEMDELVDYLSEACDKLFEMGADFGVLSANTPHIVFDQIQDKVKGPLISLVDETLKKAQGIGLNRLGLIGTKFTMEQDFFKTPFIASGNIIAVPDRADQAYIHRKIVEELEHGIINQSTKETFIQIINKLVSEHHIQGVILGCTELPLLIKDQDLDLPQLNTTEIHVARIVEEILS